MAPPAPEISVEPEHCPEAVIEWYNLSGLQDRSGSCKRKDLALKAKKHLRSLGWEFHYIDKKGRWELRYKSPTNGKNHISLRKACESCIEDGGCDPIPKNAPFTIPQTRVNVDIHPSSSPPPQANKRPRIVPKKTPKKTTTTTTTRSEESTSASSDDSESDETSSSSVNEEEEEEEEKHTGHSELEAMNYSEKDERHQHVVSPSEPEPEPEPEPGESTGSVGGGKRGKVLQIRPLLSSKSRRREGGARNLTCWLIDNQVLVPGTNLLCRGRNNMVKKGRLLRGGIACDCCDTLFTLTGFEAHAECTRHRPSTSIFLEDGRSLMECQREALSSTTSPSTTSLEGKNDVVCSVCHYGGDIILCDKCPSSFHLSCLGLDSVPDGDWFCPPCRCRICKRPRCREEDHVDNNVLVCVQCEQRHHLGCLNTIGFLPSHPNENWVCSIACGDMFFNLQKLVGKSINVGGECNNNLTWTLLRNTVSSESKLIVALGVLQECFSAVAISGRDVVKDVVFSRGSEHGRLNFRGFYTVVLEKDHEVVSVATVRIYGDKVAELAFVATKEQFRKRGMCRVLMDELEKQLACLGVENMVLHSSPQVIDAWTSSFGFARMTGSDKRRYLSYTFLEFEDTILCHKLLLMKPTPLGRKLSR